MDALKSARGHDGHSQPSAPKSGWRARYRSAERNAYILVHSRTPQKHVEAAGDALTLSHDCVPFRRKRLATFAEAVGKHDACLPYFLAARNKRCFSITAHEEFDESPVDYVPINLPDTGRARSAAFVKHDLAASHSFDLRNLRSILHAITVFKLDQLNYHFTYYESSD